MADTVSRSHIQETQGFIHRPKAGEQMPEVLTDVVGQAISPGLIGFEAPQ